MCPTWLPVASSERRPSEGGSTRPRLSRALPARVAVAFLVVVILVAAGVAVWSGAGVWARQRAERETEQLAGAAAEVALLLSALSGADAEASLDRLEQLGTGALLEEVTSRRAEVLQVVDDDEVRARAEVIASGVEQPVAPRGVFGGSSGPATARLLVATRAEVSNAVAESTERTWRWRIEAVLVDGLARVSSAEVAV